MKKNSDKAIGQCILYWIGNHMESNVKRLCGSEMTGKIKQLEIEGARAPPLQCPIAGDANVETCRTIV